MCSSSGRAWLWRTGPSMRAGLETRHTFKVYIKSPMTPFTQLMNISGLIVDDDDKKKTFHYLLTRFFHLWNFPFWLFFSISFCFTYEMVSLIIIWSFRAMRCICMTVSVTPQSVWVTQRRRSSRSATYWWAITTRSQCGRAVCSTTSCVEKQRCCYMMNWAKLQAWAFMW